MCLETVPPVKFSFLKGTLMLLAGALRINIRRRMNHLNEIARRLCQQEPISIMSQTSR